MTVCFAPYARDADRDAWALPHLGRPDQEDFEVDVCNANAVDLLLTLGLEPASFGVVDGACERPDRGAARGEKIGGGDRLRLVVGHGLSCGLEGWIDQGGDGLPVAGCVHRWFGV